MIWDAAMFRDEEDMLLCRMEAFADASSVEVCHVVAESRFTHRGVPKPLNFPARDLADDPEWRHVVDDFEPDPDHWVLEHHQRNAAWKVIDAEAADYDVVLICDLDEIPNEDMLHLADQWGKDGPGWPLAIPMRTFLFAVDWEVKVRVPPPCVIAPVRYLRQRAARGEFLAEVRDDRSRYPEFGGNGGWHFSWVGGPERQKAKLETATCHTEILATPEADLIRSGARWRSQEDGGGLPVVPVDVDETWPAYVHERRCPPEWFRPRGAEEAA
jgi:hypothetical protein